MSDAPDFTARPVVRIVCGPTGAGKSGLAMALAERHGLTILSADSRQVYRGFDIGTAKPTAAERARVPHEGLDLADPGERYSAAAWGGEAERVIDRVGAERVVVVGGTGLYLRTLVQPLFQEPDFDEPRRRALLTVLDAMPTPELRRWVAQLDPARAALGRTQLLRAAEVALLLGRRISVLHRERERPARYTARWLLVDPGPALHGQIDGRIGQMLQAGWLDEVRALAGRYPDDAPAWNACGYQALRDVVRGGMTLEEARHAILVSTRQYAKRQRTWFRHQLHGETVTQIDPRRDDALLRATHWWQGGSDE